MPLAVWTSRSNSRIRTQGGCFVAYNLYTPPEQDLEYERKFDYMSLEKQQERILDDGVFLYKIIIDKECCQDIVNWMKSIGISQENVYPELDKIKQHFD